MQGSVARLIERVSGVRFPYVVLAVSLILTIATAYYVATTAHTEDGLRFAALVARSEASIEARIETYVALLRAAAGLFAASDSLSRQLGLDLAREHQPDLILLDLHLPDILGEEVLRRIREDPRTREIPVVVLSADATPGQIERLLAMGARAYLTKPLDVRKLFTLLDETLPRVRR